MGLSKKLGRMPIAVASSADDRRSVCRYPVTQPGAWLGWWEDERFRSTPAEVSDLSLRGCRMTVAQLPPTRGSVWFCPSGPAADPSAIGSSSDWIEARLVESRKRLFGPRVVRIVFRRSFPYEVFKSVVYGAARVGGLRPKLWVPETGVTEDRDWW